MFDIMSVIANSYATAPPPPTTTKYTNVDPKQDQGTWKGPGFQQPEIQDHDFRRS